MYLGIPQKALCRKTSTHRAIAASILLSTSSLMCAQTAQPSVCNIDSDGFCISGAVHTAPLLTAVPQKKAPVELMPVLQPKTQIQLRPALQSKLRVDFRNDSLRIDAENITLREALKEVSARTGAEIEFPAGELNERIFVHVGPGSCREVVAQLLNGSPFNYVILSSPSEPRGIARLILSSARSAHESTNSEAPVLPKNDVAATQLYGAAFGADADAPAEVLPSEKTAAIAGANPSANWAQHD